MMSFIYGGAIYRINHVFENILKLQIQKNTINTHLVYPISTNNYQDINCCLLP